MLRLYLNLCFQCSWIKSLRKSLFPMAVKCLMVGYLTMLVVPAVKAGEEKASNILTKTSAPFLKESDKLNFNTRRMLVGRIDTAVTIDGSLDEDIWKSAASGTFRSNRSLDEWKTIGWTIIPTPQLGGMGHIYAAWDDSSLYLGFRCEKQVGHRNIPPAPIASGRESTDIFKDDSVQIYLQPKSRDDVYQIVVNAKGALWDASLTSSGRFDPFWNGDGIEAAGTDAPGYYEAEVAIPFEAVGLDSPDVGDIWRVNFCRQEKPSDEKTSWSMTSEFSDEEAFGVVEFGKQPSQHSIEGRVVVQDESKVLAGAFVQTSEGLYRTDAEGRFSFMVSSPGIVPIQIGAFEYRDVALRVDVKNEEEPLPNIELPRRCDDTRKVRPQHRYDTRRDMVVLAEDLYKTEPGFEYAAIHRRYQSCPKGVAVLDNGKVLVTYTAFGRGEYRGNMVVIDSSNDSGETWKTEVVVSDGWRVAWGNFFHDPKGRLWMFTQPPIRIHRCNNPAQSPMQWTCLGLLDKDLDPRALGENSPITLSDGTYLYALARQEFYAEWLDVYVSTDQGESWHRRGSAWVPPKGRDAEVSAGEPMVVERLDGSLWMLVRTRFEGNPIGESFSYDGGRTWTDVAPAIKHTNSRFHIRRLDSGRLLLVKHSDEAVERAGAWTGGGGRQDLTAYLSEDDGKSWPHKLLIQAGDCSYPDAAQGKDGRIFIAYDRGRRGIGAEIRMAVVREEDIKNGELVSPDSKLGVLISRIGPRPESSREFSFEWTMPAEAR